MHGLKDEFLLPFSFTSLGGSRHGLEARKFHSPLHLNLSSGTKNPNWFLLELLSSHQDDAVVIVTISGKLYIGVTVVAVGNYCPHRNCIKGSNSISELCF